MLVIMLTSLTSCHPRRKWRSSYQG